MILSSLFRFLAWAPAPSTPAVASGLRCVAAAAAVVTLLCAAAPAPTASAAREPHGSGLVSLVTGTVVSSQGVAIAGATVTASDAFGRAHRGQSDDRGMFRIQTAGAGRYTLVARAVGYSPATIVAESRETSAPAVRIELTPVTTLRPVQIVGAAPATKRVHPDASDLAGAVSVLSGAQIQREQVNFAQELLRKVPGVYRAEFNQGIIAGDIGIRGFNTESDVASTKLLIDGIPSNLNSGVSEMNALFPLEIARMDVVRGTNDPRYGLFNLAGNVAIETERSGSRLVSRLQSGSFGAQEGQLLTAFQKSGFSQTLFAGLRRSDGYRSNSDLNKWSVSGKWFYDAPDDSWRIGVIGRSHRLETAAPGYLTFAQSRTAPRLSPTFSAADGGSVATDHGSVHVDVQQTKTLAWSLRGYAQHFDRVRYVRFTAAGAQQERIEDERQHGAIATVTWRPAAAEARALVVTGGADFQRQENEAQRFRTADRTRAATLRDQAFALDNMGGYVQMTASPLSRVQVAGGIRADRFSGAFRNRLTSTSLPILDDGWISQPKASVSVQLARRLSTYANYGRAFQIGVGAGAYGATPLAPSRNDGAEVGIVAEPARVLSVRAGVWQQKASDEVRLKFDNSGDSENIGRTSRRGVDVEGTLRLPRAVSVWVAGTSQRAVLVEPGLTNASSRGKLLNHVPRWTAKYGADWTLGTGLHFSFWSYLQGAYQITPQNDRGTWGDIRTVNADVSWRWRAVAVGLGATNLFSRYSEYAWWDGTQTLHSPAPPRSLFLTMTVDR
jgi:iron complex outermembrane recepter protein